MKYHCTDGNEEIRKMSGSNPLRWIFSERNGSWHGIQSEQRSEPSAGVGVQEGKDSPGVMAQFSLHLFHLGESIRREHQGITSAVGA
jgi:hypothetical protein